MDENNMTALYQKMAEEQQQFCKWLKLQTPDEILNHANEYVIRGDILIALESLELPDAKAEALLMSEAPLYDVYDSWVKQDDSHHMENLEELILQQAEKALKKYINEENKSSRMKNIPVYRFLESHAHEHGEIDAYRTSDEANLACKKAIEAAIHESYSNNRLNGSSAARQVVEQFGYDRVAYILANTIQQKIFDGRFAENNREWANTIPPLEKGDKRNRYFIVNSHSGLVDLFVNQVRKEYESTRKEPFSSHSFKHTPTLENGKPSLRDSLEAAANTAKHTQGHKRETAHHERA